MNSGVVEAGSQLLQLAAQPTLQLAAATQASSSQQPLKQSRRGASNGLDPVELADGLECQLLRVSDKLHRNMLSALLFITSTLSVHQVAVLFIACFPRIASAFGVANVAHKRVQQRQQALLAAVERNARQSGTLPAPLVQHPQAGLLAPCSLRSNSAAACDRPSKAEVQSSASIAPYMLQEQEQQRIAQLLYHQQVCWEQLGCQPTQELE
jgi:hypothetical protein